MRIPPINLPTKKITVKPGKQDRDWHCLERKAGISPEDFSLAFFQCFIPRAKLSFPPPVSAQASYSCRDFSGLYVPGEPRWEASGRRDKRQPMGRGGTETGSPAPTARAPREGPTAPLSPYPRPPGGLGGGGGTAAAGH